MSKVSEEERSLILLKEVEGHSVEELAGMTGLNENTIKVKLFRTRQKLLKAAGRLTQVRCHPPPKQAQTRRKYDDWVIERRISRPPRGSESY